ncbi:MAG: hypothetical protein PVJ66_07555 [Gammaproteobacteria bacterium]|jgi:hypothetical protein
MPPTGNKKVNQCIAVLCERGCSEVYACIEALRSGGTVTEAAMLDEQERRVLLEELESIMAAYEGGCEG